MLTPNDSWAVIGGGIYPEGIQLTDDGRYKVAVAPGILDPNYPDDGKIWSSDFDGINRNIDVVLEHKTTGEIITIECYVSDIKAHSFNEYNGNGNNVSFDIDSGLVQTGVAYPNSWNAKNETPFSAYHSDGSVIEFAGHSTGGFKPYEYKMVKILVYK